MQQIPDHGESNVLRYVPKLVVPSFLVPVGSVVIAELVPLVSKNFQDLVCLRRAFRNQCLFLFRVEKTHKGRPRLHGWYKLFILPLDIPVSLIRSGMDILLRGEDL